MTFNIGGFSQEDKNYIQGLGINPAADGKADDISLDDLKKAKRKFMRQLKSIKKGKEKFDEAVALLFVKLNEKAPTATDAFLQALVNTTDTNQALAREVADDAEKGFTNKDVERAGIKDDNKEIKDIVYNLFMTRIDEDGYNKLKNFLDAHPDIKTSFNKVAAEYANDIFASISSEGGDGADGVSEKVFNNAKKIGKEKDRLIKEGNALDAYVLMITAMEYEPGLNPIESFKTNLDGIMAAKETPQPTPAQHADESEAAPPPAAAPAPAPGPSVDELEKQLLLEKADLTANENLLIEQKTEQKLKRIEFMEKTFKATKGFAAMKKNPDITQHTSKWIEDNIIKKYRSKLGTQAVNAAGYNNVVDKISAYQAYANYLKLTNDGKSDLETEKAAAQGLKDKIAANKTKISGLEEQINAAKEAAQAQQAQQQQQAAQAAQQAQQAQPAQQPAPQYIKTLDANYTMYEATQGEEKEIEITLTMQDEKQIPAEGLQATVKIGSDDTKTQNFKITANPQAIKIKTPDNFDPGNYDFIISVDNLEVKGTIHINEKTEPLQGADKTSFQPYQQQELDFLKGELEAFNQNASELYGDGKPTVTDLNVLQEKSDQAEKLLYQAKAFVNKIENFPEKQAELDELIKTTEGLSAKINTGIANACMIELADKRIITDKQYEKIKQFDNNNPNSLLGKIDADKISQGANELSAALSKNKKLSADEISRLSGWFKNNAANEPLKAVVMACAALNYNTIENNDNYAAIKKELDDIIKPKAAEAPTQPEVQQEVETESETEPDAAPKEEAEESEEGEEAVMDKEEETGEAEDSTESADSGEEAEETDYDE